MDVNDHQIELRVRMEGEHENTLFCTCGMYIGMVPARNSFINYFSTDPEHMNNEAEALAKHHTAMKVVEMQADRFDSEWVRKNMWVPNEIKIDREDNSQVEYQIFGIPVVRNPYFKKNTFWIGDV